MRQQQVPGRRKRRLAWLAAAVAMAVVAAGVSLAVAATHRSRPPAPAPTPVAQGTQGSSASAASAASAAPDSAAPHVCGNASILGRGPRSAPAGAIRVRAGNDSGVNWGQAHKTYWFAPGVHTLGGGAYTQIMPANGATFVGAPGAILSGQHRNYYAFVGHAKNVRISYLTVENFGTSGGNQNQGVVNHDSAAGWTVDHSTLEDNAGAGTMLGSNDTLMYDCLRDNQQYGFSAYSAGAGPANLVVEHNEIAGNDTYNWESRQPGCGCSGGGKFWSVNGATVTNNWVHDNHNVGLWADTNNRGFDIEHNTIQGNYGVGLIYEISYNALISGNTFIRNGIGEGPHDQGFPNGAIYLSESGSDSRVPGKFGKTLSVTGNTFTDNWSGVTLWENSNRFCGSPDNTSSGYCTLVDPSVANLNSCSQAHLKGARPGEALFNECRWKTQNVLVAHNVFNFNPASIGPDCTAANGCGIVGVFSEWGSDPAWSPYQGPVIENFITSQQNNHFADNTYNGPWRFMAHQLGTLVPWQTWRGTYAQDPGSTLNS